MRPCIRSGDRPSRALFPGLDESNADLGPFDPNEFAPPESQSGRGQQQKKFLGLKHVKRSIDIESGTR
jgi:hypothetical protein